ncbi:MAG: hypothetical protein K0S32_3098 [Bacteroidetes bacterium]|jgi:hypothetical protein|nr:hypothetical protein [Bacteroidota bacterium]
MPASIFMALFQKTGKELLIFQWNKLFSDKDKQANIMCFSATASFTAGGLLLATGTASIAKSKEPSQLAFASIPFLFSLQQFTEGFLWLNFKYGYFQGWEQALTIIFILFAQMIWPVFIPLSFLLLEKHKVRKRVPQSFTLLGILMSLYILVCLFIYPVQSEVGQYHIYYKVSYPDL